MRLTTSAAPICTRSKQLSDVVLKVTGADPALVHHQETEILTTKLKRVDTSKSVRDLDHKNSYSLEDGMRLTADWMRSVYRVRNEQYGSAAALRR